MAIFARKNDHIDTKSAVYAFYLSTFWQLRKCLAPPPGEAGPAATAQGAAGGSVEGPSSCPAVAGYSGILWCGINLLIISDIIICLPLF